MTTPPEGTDPCPREGGSPSRAGPPPCGQEPVGRPRPSLWVPVLLPTALLLGLPYGATSISQMRWGARREPSWGHSLGFFFTPKVRMGHPSLTPFFSWSWFKSGPFWLACLLSHPEVEAHGVTEAALSLGGQGVNGRYRVIDFNLLHREREELKQQDQQIHWPL